MEVDIQYRPSFSMGIISLAPHEEVRVESGAMVSMSSEVTVETKAAGGFLKSLSRSLLGGESFFMNTFKASARGGQIMVAPALPGDLYLLNLVNERFMVQSGGFVAAEMSINVDTKWSGAKTFYASEGFIMLNCSGNGKLLISSYGAIHEVVLSPNQLFTVDSGHIVAFTEGMGFKVRTIGGLKSTLFSGEGLVVDLTGPGRVLLQTRSAQAFISWLIPKLPKSSGGSSD